MAQSFAGAAWSALTSVAPQWRNRHIRDLFDQEPQRSSQLTMSGAGVTVDLSRQRIDSSVMTMLHAVAQEVDIEEARNAMFRGERINTTEDRAVLHTALRMPRDSQLIVDGRDVIADVHEVLDRMATCSESIRNGSWLGFTGHRIEHVVNIGIGGSDLGPVMAYETLRPFSQRDITFDFVSNVDGTDLAEVLKRIDPLKTVFIIASKTFSTHETMLNAHSARTALLAVVPGNDVAAVSRHFVAVSTNEERVREFGIDPANMFGFWDWVGGRYSMDSSIGLSTMIAIGHEHFAAMLNGFHAMDEHFRTSPIESNLPVAMALVGMWNRSFLGISSTAVLPYDQYLHRLPAYLQQLIMESNGKSVTLTGASVPVETSAVYWGEPGTNGQHSFYQLLHQGTSPIACDVLIPAKSHNPLPHHHDVLVSNALAQARVLAFGRSADEVQAAGTPDDLIAHRVMPGNRPTTLITVDQIDPFTLGAIVAMYEHMVFVQGVLWGINSFDQWGVELGKELATSILPFLTNSDSLDSFDSATAQAITWYRKRR